MYFKRTKRDLLYVAGNLTQMDRTTIKQIGGWTVSALLSPAFYCLLFVIVMPFANSKVTRALAFTTKCLLDSPQDLFF